MKILAAPVVCFLLVAAVSAQDDPGPALVGDWKGTLDAGVELRLVLKVKRDEAGALRAVLDSVDQGAHRLEVDEIALDGRVLRFSMKRLRAGFEGTMEADGSAIDGTWTQGGTSLPLRFEPMTEPIELVRPQMPKPPFPYRSEEVAFRHAPAGKPETTPPAAVVLAGTLTLPAGDGPFPAAVLISGSGPQDRDETLMGHKPFLVLADHLTRAGIAVLRYDDRGVAKSKGSFPGSTSFDFADDAEAAVRFLATRNEIDSAKIGLVGHSEGGLIAPIVASRSKAVAFAVLMAGPGVAGHEILMQQGAKLAEASGASAEHIAWEGGLRSAVFAVLRAAKPDDDVADALRAKARASWEACPAAVKAVIGERDKFVEQQVAALVDTWMRTFITYDPRPALREVRCPVLVINGELDLQVLPDQNLPAIEKALRAGGNTDFEIVRLPRLNHLFQEATTGAISEYAKIEETFNEAALQAISSWIRKRFG